MKYLKNMAHRLFRISGYDFLRYNSDNFVSIRRAKILNSQGIDLLLDIGADEGTYPPTLRETGYHGRIISFEPLPQSFHLLQQRADGDPLWSCENMAIGDFDGTIEINVSAHKTSSSILPMTQTHIQAMPASDFIGKEKVKVARLDSLLNKFNGSQRLYLKIDVQGYEQHVLLGAAETLKRTYAMEMELSLTPLYQGGMLMDEMLDYLGRMNFNLVSMEPVFFDPKTGNMLQADGIFIKH